MTPTTTPPWINARDAVRLLRVTPATLYAYVSRGFIRSETTSGKTRARRYSRDDVDRLRRRAEERRNPDKVAANAMQWGLPVLESSISLIADGALYYRGHDAVALARSRSVDEVAALIWTGSFDSPSRASERVVTRSRRQATEVAFIARAQSMLALAAAEDPSAFDMQPAGVARTGARIMRRLAESAAEPSTARAASGARTTTPTTIDAMLGRAWRVNAAGVDLLRATLILCADHELNVSAFTARCVASSGSNPYAVVIAGLAALEGVRHGGSTIRVEAMLGGLRREPRLRAALSDRLRRGERIDGFGHPLYRDGDPRAHALLDMLRESHARSPEFTFIRKVADAATALTDEHPNLDFALGAVARVLKLPRGAGLTLFAIGRTIGWIGHALEQYATGQLIRPRAKYVGVTPVIGGDR